MKPVPTVLFADDEPWLTESLRITLESRGLECTYESDASAALKYIQTKRVSVLVTDVMMPAGDLFPGVDSSETGFHLVNRVRQEWPAISVICLSVIGDQDKIEKLKRRGVLYLRKGETPLETAAKLIYSKATGTISF